MDARRTRHDSSPVFFGRPRVSRSAQSISAASIGAEGARDALDPEGPTDLDASQHRGMLKSGNPPSPLAGLRRASRKSARPKASRARCLVGLLRVAPGGLSFQALLLSQRQGLSTTTGPDPCRLSCDRHRQDHHCGPATCGRHAGTARLEPPGGESTRRISGAPVPRPPLPAPRLETLIRHPSATGRDGRHISLSS